MRISATLDAHAGLQEKIDEEIWRHFAETVKMIVDKYNEKLAVDSANGKIPTKVRFEIMYSD
jgi:hypothetical protein